MAVYDIDGNVISASDSSTVLGFNRVYSYANPYLLFEMKDLNNSGQLVDSTSTCVIHLPKNDCVEVRTRMLSGQFKIAKVLNGSVTWLVSSWSYYYYRYIGDRQSDYYCIVSLSPGADVSEITVDRARARISVFTFHDIGCKYVAPSSLNKKHVAVIGDSITQGIFRKYASTGLDSEAVKPFGSLIAEVACDTNYGNFGIGGATVSNVIGSWESLVTNCSKVNGYDVVFICGGTNDYGNNASSSTFTTAYQTVVDTLKANNTEVVACTPVYRTSKTGTNTQGLTLQDYCNIIKSIATSKSIKCIDLYALTNDGVFITHCPDGLHPNEIGHKIIADLIIEQYDVLTQG